MRVLAATDMSPASSRALQEAFRIEGARLAAIHVMPNLVALSPFFPQDTKDNVTRAADLERNASEALKAHVRAFAPHGAMVETFLEQGIPHICILERATQWRADLIVVANQGHSALSRMLLGSVAERIAREATCSVQIVRGPSTTNPVIVAADLSVGSTVVLERAAEEAKRLRAPLHVVHVLDHVAADFAASAISQFLGAIPPVNTELLRQAREQARLAMTQRLTQAGVTPAELVIEDGTAANAVIAYASKHTAQLVVTGSHGSSGVPRLFLGSVAERIVRGAPCSVLIAR